MDRSDSQYAGLDRRVGAYLLDVIGLYLVLAGVQYGLSLLTGGFPFNRLNTGMTIEVWVLLTFSLPTWLYFALSESSPHGATLGKRVFKLRVTDLHGEGIGRGRAFLRTLIKLIPWELTHLSILLPTPLYADPSPTPRLGLILVYLFLGLYLLAVIFTPRKRSLHDLAVGTLVLYTGGGQVEEGGEAG